MKTPRQQIIKKYARAFLYYYKKELQPRDFYALSAFFYLLKEHKTLPFLAHYGITEPEKQRRLFMHAFLYTAPDARPEIIKAVEQLIRIVVDHDRLSFLSPIMGLIVLRFFTTIGYQQTTVISSAPLNNVQKKEIIESFSALTHKKIDATFEVDTQLIAGIKIISQDYAWESTIFQKINALSSYAYRV